MRQELEELNKKENIYNNFMKMKIIKPNKLAAMDSDVTQNRVTAIKTDAKKSENDADLVFHIAKLRSVPEKTTLPTTDVTRRAVGT